MIRPKTIIITSNHPIEDVFASKTPADIAAIKRRFKVKHFANPFNPADDAVMQDDTVSSATLARMRALPATPVFHYDKASEQDHWTHKSTD